MSRVLLETLAFALCGAALSCSAEGKLRRSPVGGEEVVQRVPSKAPKWIEVPFEEEKKSLYFKGEATGVYDSALGLRQARAQAVQNLVEAIRIKARSEFSEAIRGVNVSDRSLGRYLDSVVAWTTENTQLSGIRPEAEYREKVQVRTARGVEYRYNCYVRLSISTEDYLAARSGATEQALAAFQDEEARRLATAAKEKLQR